MFKCSECGCEYGIKPDFCECGNDIFDEIKEEVEIKQEIPAKKRLSNSDILSWIIFSVCIILSVLILLFFPKITPKEKETPTVAEKQTNSDIPGINSFWIDCKPQSEPEPVEQIKEVLNVFKPEPKKVQKQEKKPVATQTKQVTQKKEAAKPKPVQKTTAQKPVVQQQKTTPKPQSTNNIEMLNYKNGLMNRFKSNLPFAEIDGEGKCCIEFSVDSTGKLINRGFSYQSDNKSVNDAVYKMLMRTPRYEAPPSSYNGGKIKVLLKLSPTYYEMSFVQ